MNTEDNTMLIRATLRALLRDVELARGGDPPDVKGELGAFWREREAIYNDVLKAVKLIGEYFDLLEDVEADISERSGCR